MSAYISSRYQVSPRFRYTITWDFIGLVMDLYHRDICACPTYRAAEPIIEIAGQEYAAMRSRMEDGWAHSRS